MAENSSQRVAVVTGASSGIGLETAKAFAGMGWHVIAHGRTPERSKAAEAEIRKAASPDARVDFLNANLSLMSETKAMADAILGLTDRIDLLFNNAGGVRDKKYVTSEGQEETFTGNHLSPFLLTRELMPLIEKAAAGSAPGATRIVATSSLAYHSAGAVDWDDIQHLTGDFMASPTYCEAKLFNVWFSLELAKRVAARGIAVHSIIPGVVHTNFASHGDDYMQSYLKEAPGLSPEEVARTMVWVGTGSDTGMPTARHFYDMQEQPIAPVALDEESASKLWAESERILGELGY